MRFVNHVQYEQNKKHTNIYVGQHKEVRNVKLWPRLKTNEWPRYGLMGMYNITGICQFRKSVANCDKWPVYKGGQYRNFHCTSWR